MRILHIIPTLDFGGAERMVASYATTDVQHEHIISYWFGSPSYDVEGVTLVPLNVARRITPLHVFRILFFSFLLIRRTKPDRVVGWLYYGALVASLGRMFGLPVIWSIHATALVGESLSWHLKASIRLAAMLSRCLHLSIQYVSTESQLFHRQVGFLHSRDVVIENGVPTDVFSPDVTTQKEARLKIARDYGLPVDLISTKWIGCVARFDPQKDHALLLKAMSLAKEKRSDIHLFLIGPGCVRSNERLTSMIEESHILDNCHLLGPVSEMEKIYQAFDLTTLSARYGESFPMVLVESIACGVRVVTTNIGASKKIAGSFGAVVEAGNFAALADALLQELTEDKNPNAMHRYIEKEFGMLAFVDKFSKFIEAA